MKKPAAVKSLETLVALRERAVDKLTAEMAQKANVRERFRSNLERMEGLCAGNTVPGGLAALPAASLALSINFAHYKHAVMQMADTHRADLSLHEADMAVTQRALVTAAHRHEVLGQVLARKTQHVAEAARRVEQRGQDELASQQWLRTTTGG
jgi:flagellar export protein FliJ